MNATIERLKQDDNATQTRALEAYRRLVILAEDDIAPTDPEEVRAILRASGKSADDLAADCRWITGRKKLINEIAAAAEAQEAASKIGEEYEATVAELKRVSEPLRALATQLEQRRDELLKAANRVFQHGQRLAESAPSWIAPERLQSGRKLTATLERQASVKLAIEQRQAMVVDHEAQIASLKKIIDERDRFTAGSTNQQATIRANRLAELKRSLIDLRQHISSLQGELPQIEEEIQRLNRRNNRLDELAMKELWATPADLEATE